MHTNFRFHWKFFSLPVWLEQKEEKLSCRLTRFFVHMHVWVQLLCGERVHVCVYRLNLFVYNLSSTAQCRQIYISVVGIALAVFSLHNIITCTLSMTALFRLIYSISSCIAWIKEPEREHNTTQPTHNLSICTHTHFISSSAFTVSQLRPAHSAAVTTNTHTHIYILNVYKNYHIRGYK